MLFMMYCIDKPNSLELRLNNRDAHLAYIQNSSVTIQLAGPVLDETGDTMKGSLFILDANAIEEVRALNAADPYQKAGLFSAVDIRPFKKVIGN